MNQMTNVKLAHFPYSKTAKAALARKPQLFMDDEWGELTGGETIAVIDPSSGKESGLGREYGRQGAGAYTELKSVIIQL